MVRPGEDDLVYVRGGVHADVGTVGRERRQGQALRSPESRLSESINGPPQMRKETWNVIEEKLERKFAHSTYDYHLFSSLLLMESRKSHENSIQIKNQILKIEIERMWNAVEKRVENHCRSRKTLKK